MISKIYHHFKHLHHRNPDIPTLGLDQVVTTEEIVMTELPPEEYVVTELTEEEFLDLPQNVQDEITRRMQG